MPKIRVELDDDGFTNEIERIYHHNQKPQTTPFRAPKYSLGVIDRIANKCDNFQDIADALIESWPQLMQRSLLISGVNEEDVDGRYAKAISLSLHPYRFGDPTNKFKKAKPINDNGSTLAFGVHIEHTVNGWSSAAFNFENACLNSPIQIVNNDLITNDRPQKICQTALFFLADWPALCSAVAIDRLTGSNRLVESYYERIGKDRSDWWYW